MNSRTMLACGACCEGVNVVRLNLPHSSRQVNTLAEVIVALFPMIHGLAGSRIRLARITRSLACGNAAKDAPISPNFKTTDYSDYRGISQMDRDYL